MSSPLAVEDLYIFWRGEEAPGFTVYAFYKDKATCQLPDVRGIGSTVETEQFELSGSGWHVCGWDVHVLGWGAEWLPSIRKLLANLVKERAVIAWIGLNEQFADPPDLFSPSCMSNGVLLATTKTSEFVNLAGDSRLDPVTDSQLAELNMFVVELTARRDEENSGD